MIRRLALCVHQVSPWTIFHDRESLKIETRPWAEELPRDNKELWLHPEGRGWSAVNDGFVVLVDDATPVNIWNNQSAYLKRRSAPPSYTYVPCLA